jgi:hypothetical protein
MSFTRFHDDPCRIAKQAEEASGPGRYALDTPGNGTTPCFMADPYMRIQQWGANLRTNSINLESDMLGLTRNLNKDCIDKNNYIDTKVESSPIKYPTCDLITQQPRSTHPAWQIRSLERINFPYLHLDPQENVCYTFQNNLNTRILEKNSFVTKPQSFPYLTE